MNKEQQAEQIQDQKRKLIEQMLVDNNRVFSQEEMSLVSNTFFGNKDLLLTLRKFFLQGELTAEEEGRLKVIFNNSQLISIIERSLIPIINPSVPYSSDTWLDIKTEEKGAGETQNDILSKLVVIRYFEQQLDKMVNREVKYQYHIKGSVNQWESGEIKFSDLTPTGNEGHDGSFINLQARSEIISKINGTLNQLNMFAIQHQVIDPEEEKKKKSMDSNK